MKTNSKAIKVSLFLALVLSACAPGQVFGPSVTPSPTITPTFTATITPSVTPSPTFTVTPSPTPAPLGEAAFNATWEVTVLEARSPKTISPGDGNVYGTSDVE